MVTILYDGELDELIGNPCGGAFLVPYTTHTNFNVPAASLQDVPDHIIVVPD